MKIKGRTITWQRVVGCLYLLIVWISTSPLILIIAACIVVSVVFDKISEWADSLYGILLVVLSYINDEYFRLPVVFEWVKDSIRKRIERE